VTLATDDRAPTLVVHGAAATPGVPAEIITIDVATTHPDDVVCVLLQYQPATVRLAEGTSPRQVIVGGFDDAVQLTGPAELEPRPGQLVTIGSASATYVESAHFEPQALGLYGYAPRARDTLLFLDREEGTTRWLTLPALVRDLVGVTTAP